MPRERLAVAGALLLLGIVHVWGISWGLPGMPNSWAPDEFSPLLVHDAIQQKFSGGWQVLYPPAHVYVLALAMAPVEVLDRAGAVAFGSRTTYLVSFYLFRMVSVLMAAGTALVVVRIGRELFDTRSGIFAALAVGLSVPFVYYAKLANVEVPYLFWASLSLLYYLKILAGHDRRDYALFALTAALAIGTKDQAYALYVLLPITIGTSQYARWKRLGAPARPWRAFVNRNTLTVAASGLAALALIHNLPFNWTGAAERLRIMTGPITTSLQEFPNTPKGHAAMLGLGLRHLQFSMGWPFFLAALAGVVMAVRQRRREPRALALLLPIVSYWLFLIVPLMYHYDRYLLPVVLILSVFAGHAMAALTRGGSFAMARRGLAVLAVVFSVAYSASVDVLLAADSRYAAEDWMREHVPAGSRVMAVGYDLYLPRFDNFEVLLRPGPTVEELIGTRADYLVTTSLFDEARLAADPKAVEFFRAVAAGRTPYRLVYYARGRPKPILLDFDGVRTNLDKINPEIWIYRRAALEESRATRSGRPLGVRLRGASTAPPIRPRDAAPSAGRTVRTRARP